MIMASRPNEPIAVPEEMIPYIGKTGVLLRVVCIDSENGEPSEENVSKFFTISFGVPSKGQFITLENGDGFVVKSVVHQACTRDGVTFLCPKVYAQRVPDSETQNNESSASGRNEPE